MSYYIVHTPPFFKNSGVCTSYLQTVDTTTTFLNMLQGNKLFTYPGYPSNDPTVRIIVDNLQGYKRLAAIKKLFLKIL